jgi:tight adherence protein B
LADVVATVESDLVSCGAQRADLRATAAGHRATVALLAGLPILGLAMGSGIGAEPVRILTSTTIGHVLLVAGVALELLGLGWSSRLTRRALDQG